jgi:hypothetical protein
MYYEEGISIYSKRRAYFNILSFLSIFSSEFLLPEVKLFAASRL